MRDIRWGENVLGNPETFSACMHIGHKEERHYVGVSATIT